MVAEPSLLAVIVEETLIMFGEYIARDIFQKMTSSQVYDYQKMAEDISNRLQKIVDTAFYQNYVDTLNSSKRLFEDFSSNLDESILDQLHDKTSDLIENFSRFHSVESYANAIQAHTI